MPHEWEELDDEVAAGASCPMPDCGALAVASRATDGVGRDHSEPWEFVCPRCGIDFAIPKDELIFQSVPKGLALGRDSSRVSEHPETPRKQRDHHSLTKECSTMKPDRTTATRRQTPALAVMKSAPDLQEQIRRRANELYEQRGRVDGFALDDWLRAETEILGAQKQQKARAAKVSK